MTKPTASALRVCALAAAIILASPSSSAKKIKVSDGKVIYTLDTSTKTAAVTGYEEGSTSRKVTILDYILNAEDGKSYKVTSIASQAFLSSFLSNIAMPGTIETIGSSAFETCSFSKLSLPDNLKTVGAKAFYNTIYNKTPIDLLIPSSCTAIKNMAFNSCSIRSIRFNSKLTTVGEYAFAYTDITEVDVPATVTSIGEGAFAACDKLVKANIRTALTTMPPHIFNDCERLTSVNIPATVKTIGWGAFWGCKALTSIALPAGLKTIGDQAFYESGLKSISLPQGVQTLGEEAFAYVPGLTEVNIPSSVTSIGKYCFNNSPGIKTVKVNTAVPCTLGTCGFDGETYSKGRLVVPAGSEEAYRKAKEWWCFNSLYDPLFSSIEEAPADSDAFEAHRQGDLYVFSGIDGEPLTICDLTGKTLLTLPSYHGEALALPRGLCICISGARTLKLSI